MTEKPPVDQRAESQLGRMASVGKGLVNRGRDNASAIRIFVANRKRDGRFTAIPRDWVMIVNIGAIAVTALVLVFIFFDPGLVAWRDSLPHSVRVTFDIITDFGRSHWILGASAIVFVYALLRDSADLGLHLRIRQAIRAWAAFYVFASVALSGIIVNIFKYGLGRARPLHFEDVGIFSFDFVSLQASWASFPSGHATTAASFSVSMALLFPRFAGILISGGLIVAVSRTVVGAHYPSDVLGGCFLGALVAWMLARIFASQRLVFGFDEHGRIARRKGISGRLL